MTPVLAPMPRGILASVALRATGTVDPYEVLHAAYADEPFVHVLPPGSSRTPRPRPDRTARTCRSCSIADSGRIVVTCAIDNLGKGAAGQAVQNANLMLGLPETAGLAADGVAP